MTSVITSIVPATELEAVNTMLSTIGESPVSSLDDTGVDVTIAKNILREVTRQVEMRGWHFNKDIQKELTASEAGEFTLPNSTLWAEVSNISGQNSYLHYTVRDNKLYDPKNQTTEFTNISTIKMDIVVGLDYDDLPGPAREYILLCASRIFQARQLGSSSLDASAEVLEQRALVTLLNAESRLQDVNAANTGSIRNSLSHRRRF